MIDIPTSSEITKLTGLLAPGILILWVRSRFLDTLPPKIADSMTSYAIVSIAYSAISYPIFHADIGISLPLWAWQSLLYFVAPLLTGIALVFFDHSDKFYAFADRVGLRPVHHTPTAWDFAFKKREASYVLIHLHDGSEVAGAWIKGSFASSTTGDRDIFIRQMWKVRPGGWEPIDPPRSILICGGTIQMIEFIEGEAE